MRRRCEDRSRHYDLYQTVFFLKPFVCLLYGHLAPLVVGCCSRWLCSRLRSKNIIARNATLILYPLSLIPSPFVDMLTLSLPTIAALFLFSSAVVRATPCIAFDINWNLLAFGLDGKDWNAGTQDTWASGTSRIIFLLFFPLCSVLTSVLSFYPLIFGSGNMQAPLLTLPPRGVREFWSFRGSELVWSLLNTTYIFRPFDGANTACFLSQVFSPPVFFCDLENDVFCLPQVHERCLCDQWRQVKPLEHIHL